MEGLSDQRRAPLVDDLRLSAFVVGNESNPALDPVDGASPGAVEDIFPLPWGEESDMDDELSDAAEAREKGDMLIGTPAQVAEQIEGIRDLGFEKLQLMFLDFPDHRGMELFGDEVAPEFR